MGVLANSDCRFVVLISGRGSNMQHIVEALQRSPARGRVCAVLSNNADAKGLVWARERGIETRVVSHRDFATREQFDAVLGDAIQEYQPHYVLLAGFMRVLTPGFVERFTGRLVNIHPSLLPSFPGLHTHQQALATGVQWHGCTVHFVTPVLDHGPIIAQGIVPVRAGDTPDDLADRVLQVEHCIYGEVARWLADNRVRLDAIQRVHVDGVASRSYMLRPDGTVSPVP
ncbi:MAG TPA: phosphoribosylglycinamide formyltransferase [Burkholderiaceae bacterium]|nr:phosphoribosylglycinamide formyltransferase [Burkholderiaceae bacterium]